MIQVEEIDRFNRMVEKYFMDGFEWRETFVLWPVKTVTGERIWMRSALWRPKTITEEQVLGYAQETVTRTTGDMEYITPEELAEMRLRGEEI